MPVRPIFVLGSPRSGTTMIGNYIGSAASVLNAGEYRAIYLTHGALPAQLHGGLTGLVPSSWEPYRDRYIREAQRHSIEFIFDAAAVEGRQWFCDSYPRNVFIAPLLRELFPDALFVLTLRHYTGVIQSLLRLGTINVLPGQEAGMDWFDPTAVAAGVHWSRHYEAAMELPNDRTIEFGYDRFCAAPQSVLTGFKGSLAEAGFPVDELDDTTFATSHGANYSEPQATVGNLDGGVLTLRPRPSYDAADWTESIEADVRPAVAAVDQLLAAVFPEDYSPPAGYRPSDSAGADPSALPAPNPQAGVVESADSSRAASRREPARRRARSQPRAPREAPAPDTSSRSPRARGR